MPLTTKIFDLLGFNRDSLSLFWAKWIAFIVALAPMGVDVTKYGIPASWVPYIQLAALFISVSSAQHRTSGLPGENDAPVKSQMSGMGVGALLLACVLAGAAASACGPISVKQQIDRDDRAAFESLRTFQQAETAAYHAKLPWPTAAQHQQIGAKLSQAYTLVIDVAHAGLALKTGVPLASESVIAAADLAKLVAEIVDLAKQAPPPIASQATKAQTTSAALITHVTGGK